MTAAASLVSDNLRDPLVTIAIPTFNRAALLQDCLAAALGQTYGNFEVLVSDNASTDETAEILKSLSDRRLHFVRQEANIGLLRNLNALLENVRGEFVVFVPDDDRIAPVMLERCIALTKCEQNIPAIVALCDVWFVARGQDWRAPANQRLGTGIWDGAEILYEFLKDRMSVAMCSVMYRTERLRAGGGFPLDFPYAADIATWAPLLLEGRAGLVNEACATIALHDASQTSDLTIDVRVSDGRKVVNLIAGAADRHLADPRERRKIKIEAERHFARRAVKMIALYRRQGAAFLDVVSLMWRLRHVVMKIKDIGQLAKLCIVLFLPAPIVRWVRYAVKLLHNVKLAE
ncbi:glycosyltransferase family 2 protein [Nitrobacter sp. TKz-YC02]|uniref:glycosyltransferase family 2 protein n=1 Tax=Nitrobacter sp. TKz-YC02 TaxID=3398704 RepID=UPI003CFBA8ED